MSTEPLRGSLPTPARFEQIYHETPPWEIGRPQAAFLDARADLHGRVLDAGCGTGELALMAAADGLDATGIDAASSAIEIARHRATSRGLKVTFIVGDVLRLADDAPGPYDTVLDSGLLHVFDADTRPRYIAQLAAVIAPGGTLMVQCFSDHEPGSWGPYRLSTDDLRSAFADGWSVTSIDATTFVLADMPAARAWFARIRRI